MKVNSVTNFTFFLDWLHQKTGLVPVQIERTQSYWGGGFINRLIEFRPQAHEDPVFEVERDLAAKMPSLTAYQVIDQLKLGLPKDPETLYYREPEPDAAPDAPPPEPKPQFGAWIPTLAGGYYRVGDADTMPDGAVVSGPDGRQYKREQKFFFYGYHPVAG